ncbi:hypothetical protein CCR75_007584 [Bremia lactucae]|uniref:Uncharacterized protein n=1 Tax=Bremia lactucae TaxID=4779 RepID=A0A976IE19_BRELC|nr:hypothetical protein CCR75_007584 [Bremia lactucae]
MIRQSTALLGGSRAFEFAMCLVQGLPLTLECAKDNAPAQSLTVLKFYLKLLLESISTERSAP